MLSRGYVASIRNSSVLSPLKLLEIANVNSVSFRIGQISGGPPLGAWPVTEWFPILVKSSIAMKLLPVFGGVRACLLIFDDRSHIQVGDVLGSF